MSHDADTCASLIYSDTKHSTQLVKNILAAEAAHRVAIYRYTNCVIIVQELSADYVRAFLVYSVFNTSVVTAVIEILQRYSNKRIIALTEETSGMAKLLIKFGFIAQTKVINNERVYCLHRGAFIAG